MKFSLFPLGDCAEVWNGFLWDAVLSLGLQRSLQIQAPSVCHLNPKVAQGHNVWSLAVVYSGYLCLAESGS